MVSRASTSRGHLDGMRRRSKDAKPDYLVPRKKGNRLKGELKGGTRKGPTIRTKTL